MPMGPGVAVTCKFPRETMRSNWRYMKSKFPRSRNYARDSQQWDPSHVGFPFPPLGISFPKERFRPGAISFWSPKTHSVETQRRIPNVFNVRRFSLPASQGRCGSSGLVRGADANGCRAMLVLSVGLVWICGNLSNTQGFQLPS